MRTVALLLALAACNTPAILTPPSTGGCRETEHQCQDRACCLENWICGGDVESCPADECCYIGEPVYDARKSHDAGSMLQNIEPKRRP